MSPMIEFGGVEVPESMPLPATGESITIELLKVDGPKPSKSSGNPMVELTFAVLAPGEIWNNMQLWEYLVLTPAEHLRTCIKAKNIGKSFGLTDAEMVAAGGVDFPSLVGRTCTVVLKKDKDREGVETRRIKSFVAA